MQQSAMTVFRPIGSLRLTAPAMLCLMVGIFVSYRDDSASVWWMVIPTMVLASNLLAALVVNPRLRRQRPLLVFHLCLVGIAVLGIVDLLTMFTGRVELSVGQNFVAASVVETRRGPYHELGALHEVRFTQGHFSVGYAPGLIRGRTMSEVGVRPGDGSSQRSLVGDNVPIEVEGYRFFTTSNKGYAAVVTWLGLDGVEQTGSVHFPTYPMREWRQVNELVTPAGETVRFSLEPSRRVDDGVAWTLDSRSTEAALRAQVDDGSEIELVPGSVVRVDGGALRFDHITMWMGYEIEYRPMLRWFFVMAWLGLGAVGWHFFSRFRHDQVVGVHSMPLSLVGSDRVPG